MAIRVNIGEAKDRLSQLLAAAKRGEDVVIARAGHPEVRLVAIEPGGEKQTDASRRRAFVGSVPKPDVEIDWFAPMSDDELALWYDSPIFPDDNGAVA
jgi:prevent-host-death family protein